MRKRKAINQTQLLELRDVEHGSFLSPVRLRNPLGLLIFKHTPHVQGLKKCLMDSMQMMTKTCLLPTSAFSLLFPTAYLEGSLTTWKNVHGFNILHGTWEKSHHFFQWSHKKLIKTGPISTNICWFICFYYPLTVNFGGQLRIWKKRGLKEMVLFTVSTSYPLPSVHTTSVYELCAARASVPHSNR